jgi:hypothetical protein
MLMASNSANAFGLIAMAANSHLPREPPALKEFYLMMAMPCCAG